MINELVVAERIADGTLPSPQQFGASWYWAIRISGVGAAWREVEDEFCWREPDVWLTPEMCARAASLPVLVDHPEKGTLNSPEFAARCVGRDGLRISSGATSFGRSRACWTLARTKFCSLELMKILPRL